MSYLPRMSKTYKEPQQQQPQEEPEPNDGHHPLQPASSLLNEKTHNPQIALKHYKYLPHPLPTLPGPSVAVEATENELYREISRHRRSSTKCEDIGKPSLIQFAVETPPINSHVIKEIESKEEIEHPKPSTSKKAVKGSKTHVSKKRSSKTLVKKKESTTKLKDVSINMCLVETDITKSFMSAQTERKERDLSENNKSEFLNRNELNSLKREKSIFPLQTTHPTTNTPNSAQSTVKESKPDEKKVEVKEKELTHRSVQCTIFGSAEKVFVIPPVINSLLRALAFLLHEVNREEAVSCTSGEKKRLMNQIQLILGDLCNQKSDKEFGFNTTYSDSKRMEKMLGELQKYIKDTYGDKAEHSDRADKIKKVYVDLKNKEMELNFLNEKLSEKETLQINDVEVKENDYKNSDITLQNKRLENEQLVAQLEFSFMELKKYQKALAEVEWDIKTSQEQVNSLKKSFVTKSKTDIIGKKSSTQKSSSDLLSATSRSKETEMVTTKKKCDILAK